MADHGPPTEEPPARPGARLAVPALAVVAAVTLLLVSPGSGGGDPSGSWELVRIDGEEVTSDSPGRAPWVDFDGGSISGNDGGNDFSGGYQIRGSTIHTSETFSTLGGCVGCANAGVIGEYLEGGTIRYRVDGDRLVWTGHRELEFVALAERRDIDD